MLRIEMDRLDGLGWRLRGEGAFAGTVVEILSGLPAYAIQYPHRAYLDGVLVAEIDPRKIGCDPAVCPLPLDRKMGVR